MWAQPLLEQDRAHGRSTQPGEAVRRHPAQPAAHAAAAQPAADAAHRRELGGHRLHGHAAERPRRRGAAREPAAVPERPDPGPAGRAPPRAQHEED